MKNPPPNALVWFAVLGGPAAWVVQFLINLEFSYAQCDAPAGRWQLPVHAWEIAVSASAAVVALAAGTASLWLFRRTFNLDHIAEAERRGEGTAPPTGRINFLATVGLTVNFLALAIIVMDGIGAPLLPVCQQS